MLRVIGLIKIGCKLHYINKNSLKPECVIVAYIDNEGFGFYYEGLAHKLPFSALGRRLFMSPTDMWIAWNNSPLVLPERTKEIEPAPKPEEETKPPQKPPKEIHKPPKSAASKDLVRECAECGRRFVWTVGEQEFYKENKLSPPRTCSKECRERRQRDYRKKEERQAITVLMKQEKPTKTGRYAKPAKGTWWVGTDHASWREAYGTYSGDVHFDDE